MSVEIEVKFRVETDQRYSFDSFGDLGQSISSILRNTVSAGARDRALAPAENSLMRFELKKATVGSLEVFGLFVIDEQFFKDLSRSATIRVASEIIVQGLKSGLNHLLKRNGDTRDISDAEAHAKLLSELSGSIEKLARILDGNGSTKIKISTCGQEIILDDKDIKGLIAEPQPGETIHVLARPLSLHSETGSGWLRVEKSSAGNLRPVAYRSELDLDSSISKQAFLQMMLDLMASNGRASPSDRRAEPMLIVPMETASGLVRKVLIKGLVDPSGVPFL